MRFVCEAPAERIPLPSYVFAMKRLLLIDGDIMLFKAAAATEHETQWNDWLFTLHADLDEGIRKVNARITELTEALHADRLIFALSSPTNFRKKVYPEYKAHRVKTRKPVTYAALREYLQETQETFERPDLEADDVLGILATAQKFAQYERILVSEDKDFKTIPGLLLNDGKARKRITDDPSLTLEDCIETVTEAEADRHHLFQTLTGDTSDGYPGCPKAGPVTANKILDADCSWAAVVAAYEKQGLSEDVALTNARVARICRASDYDFRKGKVILWNPHFNSLAPSPSL